MAARRCWCTKSTHTRWYTRVYCCTDILASSNERDAHPKASFQRHLFMFDESIYRSTKYFGYFFVCVSRRRSPCRSFRRPRSEVLEEDGKTAVMVTVDGKAVGVVAVADIDKEVRLGFSCCCKYLKKNCTLALFFHTMSFHIISYIRTTFEKTASLSPRNTQTATSRDNFSFCRPTPSTLTPYASCGGNPASSALRPLFLHASVDSNSAPDAPPPPSSTMLSHHNAVAVGRGHAAQFLP